MRLHRTANALAVLAALLSAHVLTMRAEARDWDFVVSPGQVAHALGEAGVAAPAERIEFLSQVRTRHANEDLRLISVAEWQEGTLKAEMGCAERRDCLPFYVLVRDTAISPDLLNGRQAKSAEATPASPKMHDVHKGDAAILFFESNDSRITMRVICMQNGDRGERIRVASADRKHFYQAEIIEPGLVKGMR